MKDTAKELLVARACRLNDFDNNSNFNANNRDVDNSNNGLRGIVQPNAETYLMKNKPRNLWHDLCSYENLFLAYRKARKRKTLRSYVIEFEKDLENNLLSLRFELLLHSYEPKPLVNFIIRDPKTRKISKSHFRDRVVHHAICNIIEPIFQRTFVYDSCANQKGKGTHLVLKRFDEFKRKVSKNNTKICFVLKADIKHYFETVGHKILIKIISKKIKDKNIVNLIRKILKNHKSKLSGKGMPLGNLTSQFFANVYLNELDHFVKHKLKAKYYLRYVDDFVILHNSKIALENYEHKIDNFLKSKLKLELHPDKCKIKQLSRGISLLGYRVFYYHKLLRKSNLRKFKRRLVQLEIDDFAKSLAGWLGYARWANTYKLRCKLFN